MAYLGHKPAVGENNSFRILDDISSYVLTFDGSSASVVSLSNETITMTDDKHRYITGQRVTYSNGGGGNITGLVNGQAYFVINHSSTEIKLASSASNALTGTAINLTGLGTGSSHTLTLAFDGVNTKFMPTFGNGLHDTLIKRAAQLVISLNGIIQQPHDTATPTTGFGVDALGNIIFSKAPVSTDIFWAHVLASNTVTFDSSDNDVDTFTGNGSTSSFTLSKVPPDNRNILVTIDGVVQYPSDAANIRSYSVSENVMTFTAAPGNGTVIQVRHIGYAGPSAGGGGGVTGFYGRTGNVSLQSTDNIVANNATFSGNVSIAKTLTYEDVTDIDSVGLITARSGIKDQTLTAGHVVFAGTGGRLSGEAQLFYDTSNNFLGIGTNTFGRALTIRHAEPRIRLVDDDTGSFSEIYTDNTGHLYLNADAGGNNGGSRILFNVDGGEKARITTNGEVGIGTNPREILHVNKNTGTACILVSSSTAPQIRFNPNATDGTDGDRSILGQATGNSQFVNSAVSGDTVLRGTSSGSIKFGIGNDEKVRITSSGNLEIINNNDYLKIGAGGALSMVFTGGQSYITNSTGHLTGRSASYTWENLAGTAEYARITSGGKVGIGTVSPLGTVDIYNSGSDASDLNSLGAQINAAWIRIGDVDAAGKTFSNGLGTKLYNQGTAHWSYGVLGSDFLIANTSNDGNKLFPSNRTAPVIIKSTGEVGIGTENPSQPLTIARSSNGQSEFGLRFQFTDTAGPTHTSSAFLVGTYGLKFKNYNSSRNFLFETGNVGIGTNNPSRKLDLHESSSSGNFISITNDTTGHGAGDGALIGLQDDESLIISNKENNHIEFHTDNDEQLRITSAGTLKFTGQNTSLETAGITHHTNNNLYIRGGTSGLVLGNHDSTNTIHISNSNFIKFETNDGSEKFKINSIGQLTSTASNNGQIIHYFKNTDTTSGSSAMTVEQHFNFDRTGGGLNVSAARIIAGKEREWVGAASNQDGYFAIHTTKDETSTERLRITSAGEVQINYAAAGQTVLSCVGLYDGGSNTSVDIATFARQGNAVKTAVRYNDPTTSMRFGTSTTHDFGLMTDGTERLHISSTGSVGIGTDSPQKELHILGGADTCLRITSSSNGVASLQLGDVDDTVKGAITFKSDDNSLRIRGHNNADRIVIDSSGRSLVKTNGSQATPIADNNVPLQIAESTGNMCYFGANKGGSYGSIFGHHTHYGGTVIRNLTSDNIVFMTNNNQEKLRITPDGRVGIGLFSNLIYQLEIKDNSTNLIRINNSGESGHGSHDAYIVAGGSYYQNPVIGGSVIKFNTFNGSTFDTRVRIDSGGRLLINTTTDRNKYFNGTYTGQLQVEGTNDSTRLTQFVHNSNNASGHIFVIGKSRGTTTGSYSLVQDNDYLGTISFQGADGDEMVDGARIEARVNNGNGNAGNDDMPTDLIFRTNQGHNSPRETLRITSRGQFLRRQQGYSNSYQQDNFGTAMYIKGGWLRFSSSFNNPTKDLVILEDGGTANHGLYIKVTVMHLDYPGQDYGVGNIHIGYASAKRKGDSSGQWHVDKSNMALESGSNFHGQNGNVGTLAWSDSNPSDTNTLSYTANRHANYDQYHVQVEVWQRGNCLYYLHEDFVQ